MKYTVLVVDDDKSNLELFQKTLSKKYNLLTVASPAEALAVMHINRIDMVISDHKPPQIDGVKFLRDSVNVNPDSIRILITSFADQGILMTAINEGKIHRYMKKPWIPSDLINIVEASFEVYQLNLDNQKLALDLKELFSGTISAITEALDAKDQFTFGRSKRVTFYALRIGEALGLSDYRLSELELAGLLHDIGMIGISEDLLSKPEDLSEDEYEMVKNHVIIGMKILEEIKQLNSVIRIVGCHHEHYDGGGYPYGLKGDEIPVESQVIAIADAYDGMVSDRAYRKGIPHEEAVLKIKQAAGTQFDPRIIEAFERVIDETREEVKKLDAQLIKELKDVV